jgi:glyoxylase-like metal-dependent hydrolase (beta-lactamase superfamily II)
MDEIVKDLYRLGNAQQPAFVVIGQDRIVQVDAGTAFMGPSYLRDIRKLLGKGRGPDLLFFTHLHFDHVGSAPYLLRHFPEMKLGGSEMIVRLLTRAKMGEILTLLNQGLVKKNNMESDFIPQDFDYSTLNLDWMLKDGDVIDLGGGIVIEVIATPGHTRDSLSFFLPHTETVLAGEALGIIPGDDFWVAPQFLSSFENYIHSIERIREKKPKVIVLGHHYVVGKQETGRFFEASLADCRAYREMIEQYLQEAHMEQERVIQRIKEEEYLTLRKGKQPEQAFLINLKAQVKLIARSMNKVGTKGNG